MKAAVPAHYVHVSQRVWPVLVALMLEGLGVAPSEGDTLTAIDGPPALPQRAPRRDDSILANLTFKT